MRNNFKYPHFNPIVMIMKNKMILTILSVLFAYTVQAQMTFVNKNTDSNFPSIDFNAVRTNLYHKINGHTKLWQFWDQVPQNYKNEAGQSIYKMTVYSTDAVAKRTFEISYTIPYGDANNRPFAYMKAIFIYTDGTPSKTIEENYALKN